MWRKKSNEEGTVSNKHLAQLKRMDKSVYSWADEKTLGGVKGKITSFFKTNSTKGYYKSTHVKNLYARGKKPTKLKIKTE